MFIPIRSIEGFKIKLQHMQPRQQMYEAIKEEMQRRGHWKNKPRGKSFKDQRSSW